MASHTGAALNPVSEHHLPNDISIYDTAASSEVVPDAASSIDVPDIHPTSQNADGEDGSPDEDDNQEQDASPQLPGHIPYDEDRKVGEYTLGSKTKIDVRNLSTISSSHDSDTIIGGYQGF
jgi:hypothetical protein